MARLDFLWWGAALSMVPLASAAGARDVPENPEAWRALAARDLAAVRDGLTTNSPMFVVERDSAAPRRWLAAGYEEAVARLPRVTDAASAYFLLAGYVGGFRDSHISLGTTPAYPSQSAATRWPGIALAWRRNAYVVSYVDPARAEDLPPLGARLVDCNGRSAGTLAQERADRFDGNLLLSGRTTSATRLLWERGNPFAGLPLASCRFRTGNSTVRHTLRYGPIADADRVKAGSSAAPVLARPLGIERGAGGEWWISIPSFGRGDWDAFFAAAGKAEAQLRAARTIIIDVRGNGGGNSANATRLATLLWGEKLTKARSPKLGPVLYRASPGNRRTYAEALERYAGDAEAAGYLTGVIARFDDAAKSGAATFMVANEDGAAGPSGPNPVAGRVIILTDYACNSACLDMLDLFLAMPNVVQAGTETGADTIFMDVTRMDLPSGLFTLGYGHKAWIERPRGSGMTYRPAKAWMFPGDIGSEREWNEWLRARLAGRVAMGAPSRDPG